jgi:hypothetical protein
MRSLADCKNRLTTVLLIALLGLAGTTFVNPARAATSEDSPAGSLGSIHVSGHAIVNVQRPYKPVRVELDARHRMNGELQGSVLLQVPRIGSFRSTDLNALNRERSTAGCYFIGSLEGTPGWTLLVTIVNDHNDFVKVILTSPSGTTSVERYGRVSQGDFSISGG